MHNGSHKGGTESEKQGCKKTIVKLGMAISWGVGGRGGIRGGGQVIMYIKAPEFLVYLSRPAQTSFELTRMNNVRH